MSEDAKQSLIGVRFDEDKTIVETTHRDGSTESHPLESDKIETQTHQPQTWHRHKQVSPLVEKEVHGLTRQQRVDQSIRAEAALLKCFSSTTDIDPKDHANSIVVEILNAMGGDWKKYISRFL